MTPFIRSTLSDEKEEKGLERSEFYCDDRERERESEIEREREREMERKKQEREKR